MRVPTVKNQPLEKVGCTVDGITSPIRPHLDLDWSPIKASKASTRMDAYHVADKARECDLVARAVQRLIEGDLASSGFVSEISCKY